MLQFDRILLASDFSPCSEVALHYAATLTQQCGSQLRIVHVIDNSVHALPRWRDVFNATTVLTEQETRQNDAFVSLREHPALTGLAVDWLTVHGKPAERIIDLSPQVDLVVIGTRDHRTTLGSVARRVAHGCASPVLLVPNGRSRDRIPPPGARKLPLQRVLLALNVARYAPQAVRLSKALAKSNNAVLHVLQAVDANQADTYASDLGAGLHHNREAVRILLHKRLADVLPDATPGITIERSVLAGKAADVIVQQSRSRQADMIVMSTRPYGRLHKLFSVSTVEEVVDRAPCPVLAVPYRNQAVAALTRGNGSGNAV